MLERSNNPFISCAFIPRPNLFQCIICITFEYCLENSSMSQGFLMVWSQLALFSSSTWGHLFLCLPRTVLVYACCPSIFINSTSLSLNRVRVWRINVDTLSIPFRLLQVPSFSAASFYHPNAVYTLTTHGP